MRIKQQALAKVLFSFWKGLPKMQEFNKPENFQGEKLKHWLLNNVGNDPGTLRCRKGKIIVPDDIPITQADINSCVPSQTEIDKQNIAREIQSLLPDITKEILIVLEEVVKTVKPAMSDEQWATILDSVQKIKLLKKLYKDLE